MTAAFAFGLDSTSAMAQRGTGESTGLVRSGQSANLESVTGTVTEIKSGPCANTTGKSIDGTHLILRTDSEDALNLHLGPSDAQVIKDVLSQIKVGTKIEAAAFRTPRLPLGQWIAKSVKAEGRDPIVLRDDDLRPTWQGRKLKRRSLGASGLGPCI